MPTQPQLIETFATPFSLKPATADEIRSLWPAVQAPLAKLLKRSAEYDVDDVLEQVRDGSMQLWFSGDSFVITQVQILPRVKMLVVLWACGNLDTIKEHLPDLSDWAKDLGCDAMRIQGREGWGKVFGMEQTGVILETEL